MWSLKLLWPIVVAMMPVSMPYIASANGRGGRDIVLSPVAHGVFPGARCYGKGTRQSCGICGEAVQTGQNRMTDDSDGLREEGRETGVSHPLRIRLHLSYLLNARRYLAVKGAPLVACPDTWADMWQRLSLGNLPQIRVNIHLPIPSGALQPKSGVEPWGTHHQTVAWTSGLAFRGEAVASQGRPQPGHRLGNAEVAWSGGWFVLETVSGPYHITGNITQEPGPRTWAKNVPLSGFGEGRAARLVLARVRGR